MAQVITESPSDIFGWNQAIPKPVWTLGAIQLAAHRLGFASCGDSSSTCMSPFLAKTPGNTSQTYFWNSFSTKFHPHQNSALRFSELTSLSPPFSQSSELRLGPPPFSSGCRVPPGRQPGPSWGGLACLPSLRDHRSDLSSVQCLETVVLSVVSHFPVIDGRRVNLLPVFPLWLETEILHRTHFKTEWNLIILALTLTHP